MQSFHPGIVSVENASLQASVTYVCLSLGIESVAYVSTGGVWAANHFAKVIGRESRGLDTFHAKLTAAD